MKRAIPAIPTNIDPALAKVLVALKENIEIIAGQRVETLSQLAAVAEETGWDDLLGDVSAGRGVGANAPTWSSFRSGLSAYSFSATTMNEVWLNAHITHEYKPGTLLYPHIHWATTGTNTGVVRWGIEYTVSKGHSQGAFPVSSTIYLEQAGAGVAYTHQIVESSAADAIPATNLEPDSVVIMRVFRDAAHANDTQTSAAFAFYMDSHIEVDGIRTKTKAPGWEKVTTAESPLLRKINEIIERLQ